MLSKVSKSGKHQHTVYQKHNRIHRKSWLEDLAEPIHLRVKPMSIIWRLSFVTITWSLMPSGEFDRWLQSRNLSTQLCYCTGWINISGVQSTPFCQMAVDPTRGPIGALTGLVINTAECLATCLAWQSWCRKLPNIHTYR